MQESELRQGLLYKQASIKMSVLWLQQQLKIDPSYDRFYETSTVVAIVSGL